MPSRTKRIPGYRLHKPSGKAVVTLNGKDYYLGPHGSKVSRELYDQRIQEWLACGRTMSQPDQPAEVFISEVILAYWKHCQTYYRKNGKPTKEQANISIAMRALRRMFGRTSAASFGPLAFKQLRQHFVDRNLSRTYINDHMGRIRRMFKWALSNEMVQESVYRSLLSVDGLRRGRSAARGPIPSNRSRMSMSTQ